MSTRSKKRRSTGRIHETEPNIKQARFPAPRRMVKDKHPVWSSPRRRQQTITQMNPFHAIFHPNSNNEDLEYDEEEPQSYAASPVGRKRRKLTPEKPMVRKMETRSSARKLVKQEPGPLKEYSSQRPHQNEGERTVWKSHSSLMPPPQTPQTSRKREIPSSQSPADSPLSTQARTPARYTRTPLKERSTNCLPSSSTFNRLPQWARKLEVADSMENEENESPNITPTKHLKGYRSSVTSSQKCAPEGDSQLRPIASIAESSIPKEVPNSSQGRPVKSRATDCPKANVILDSDIESDDTEGDDQREVRHISATDIHNEQDPSPTGMQEHNQSTIHRIDHASFPVPLEDDPQTPVNSHLDPDPPSVQLFSDLHRATAHAPTGGLQTESQFENAWTTYHPPSITALSSSPLSNPPSPSPSNTHTASPPLTVPTQLLSPSKSPFNHPSQATTIDLTQTQPSPRKIPSSSSLTMPSSPPPMPPPLPSSSPIVGRKTGEWRLGLTKEMKDMWEGFKWDGRRLTDSQLLPESLVGDSYGFGGMPLGGGGGGGAGGLSDEEEGEDE